MKAFSGTNYTRNAERVKGDDYPCVICGKAVKAANRWLVRVSMSDDIHSVGANLGSNDMGCFPIGSDCLRQHPEIKPLARRHF